MRTVQLIFLSAILFALISTPAVANDLPGSSSAQFTLTGNGLQNSGIDVTFAIPVSNWPDSIFFSEVRGGDGGGAAAGPNNNPDRWKADGGGGVVGFGKFLIGLTGDSLRPGGEIRIIPGNKGGFNQGGSGGARVAGGGGGSSGVLYRGPEPGADWIPLIIAGGGGGAAVSSFVLERYQRSGVPASVGPDGSGGAAQATPGTNGSGGFGFNNGSGGGAGWLESASGDRGGKTLNDGGFGGTGNGANGGFGLTGGGAARLGSGSEGIGGGGGGGFSGGPAGSSEDPGGGGGSFLSPLAVDPKGGSIRLTGQSDGQVTWSNGMPVSNSVPLPAIILDGADPLNLEWNEALVDVDPGATATDYYGATLEVEVPADQVPTGVPGTYTVEYQATDRWGRTSTTSRTVIVLDQNKPTFSLGDDFTIRENADLILAPAYLANFAANDPGQSLSEILVEVDNPGLFVTPPFIEVSGTMVFLVAPNTIGTSEMTVRVVDTGTRNQTSDPQTFTITVEGTRLNNFRRANGMALDGSDDFGDASGNGVANLFYYAFGFSDDVTEKAIPYAEYPDDTVPGMPSIERSGDSVLVTFSFITSSLLPGVSYTWETSTDGTDWVAINSIPIGEDKEGVVEDISVPGFTGIRIVQFSFGSAQKVRLFRARVTVTDPTGGSGPVFPNPPGPTGG